MSADKTETLDFGVNFFPTSCYQVKKQPNVHPQYQ